MAASAINAGRRAPLTRQCDFFAQRGHALCHARAGTGQDLPAGGEQVAALHRQQTGERAPDGQATVGRIMHIAGKNNFRVFLQYSLDTDRGRLDRQAREHIHAAADADRIADNLAAVERVQGLVPDLVKHPHRRAPAMVCLKRGDAGPELRRGGVGHRFGAEQAAEAGQTVRHLRQPHRFAMKYGNAELAQLFQLARRIPALPDDHQVRFQRQHLFQVDLAARPHQRDGFCRRRIVAEIHRADNARPATGGKQQLRDVGRHRNDAARRRCQRDALAAVIDNANGGQRGTGRQQQQRLDDGARAPHQKS